MAIIFTSNPTVGGDSGAWGAILNTILGEIKSQIITLDSGKSDSGHTHSSYALASNLTTLQDRVAAIENLLAYLEPDLTAVDVTSSPTSAANGISAPVVVNPSIYVREYRVEARLPGGAVFYSGNSGSSLLFVPQETSFDTGDDVEIRVGIVAGTGAVKWSSWYTIYYSNTASVMTVSEVVTAFKNDTAAIQELANALHDSNLLAQKIAELSV